MNYVHSYHAGGPADIVKHVALIELMRYMQKKSTSLCYFETHTGNAVHDLTAIPAQKTREYEEGIGKIWPQISTSSAIEEFRQQIQKVNPDKQLAYYLGSSALAQSYLREHDSALLCELNHEVVRDLKRFYNRDPRVHVHHRDGYEGLSALLPSKQPRTLVLMDPPFEKNDEFESLVKAHEWLYKHLRHAVVATWYPIKQRQLVTRFHQSLRNAKIPKVLIIELCLKPDDVAMRLSGSGMVIVNPPWQFDETIKADLIALGQLLSVDNYSQVKVEWLF